MKILVLNGSPKGEKSDTMHITRAFLAGMREAAPQEVQTIDVIDRHIEFCRGCFTCKRNGGQCVIDDDMRDILEQMLASEVLLFSFPLHSYGMPAALKSLVDRMLPLSSMAMAQVNGRYVHVGQRDYSQLRFLMICGCGFPNSRRNFEPAVRQFELLFPHGRTILTVPESPMFSAPEAAAVTAPRLALVRGRTAVCGARRDRHGAAGPDRHAHDPGGDLRRDRQRRRVTHAFPIAGKNPRASQKSS